MVSKRRAPDRDDEDAGREYSEHKQPRLELDADLIADQSYSSMHTILLSGFTWDEQVAGPHITRILEPYCPIFMEVSYDLPVQKRLRIKERDQRRAVQDLDYARFVWTQPHITATAWGGPAAAVEEALPAVPESAPIPPFPQSRPQDLYQHQVVPAAVWMKLAEAVTAARAQLTGQELEHFESLIAKPMPAMQPPAMQIPAMQEVNTNTRFSVGNAAAAVGGTIETKKLGKVKVENAVHFQFGQENVPPRGLTGGTSGQPDPTPWW